MFLTFVHKWFIDGFVGNRWLYGSWDILGILSIWEGCRAGWAGTPGGSVAKARSLYKKWPEERRRSSRHAKKIGGGVDKARLLYKKGRSVVRGNAGTASLTLAPGTKKMPEGAR